MTAQGLEFLAERVLADLRRAHPTANVAATPWRMRTNPPLDLP